MPFSVDSTFDRSRIMLIIDQGRTDLTDMTTRRSLLHLQENLVSLEWTYDSAAGGFGEATVSAKVAEGTWARKQLEARNFSTAHIYWHPPETEGPVLMSDYDSHEGEFLLWSGMVSDVDLSPKTDIVQMTLMGLGEFLGLAEVDRTYTGTTIGGVRTIEDHAASDAAAAGLMSWVLDTSDAGYKEILSDGATQKKIFYSEGRATIAAHTDNLAQYLGGHPQVAWGVRNNGGASGRGQYYFSMVADPGREQTSSDAEFDARVAPYVSPLEVVNVTAEDDTSQVYNAARVFKPWDGIGTGRILSYGEAENTVSINRIGRREKTISDASAEDSTQLADRAAAFVAANSSPEVTVAAEILHDPRPASSPNAGGGEYVPLLSALKSGATKISIPFQERSGQDRSNRGDALNSRFDPGFSDRIYLKRDTTDAATLLIDCRSGSPSKTVPNAPSGIYSGSPNWKSGGDLDASMTVYNLQMKWTDTTELPDGAGAGVLLKSVAVCEWDRQLFFALVAQGTTPQTYAPALYYRDSSGVWHDVGAFTNHFGSTISKVQLLGGINIVLAGGSTIGGTDDTAIASFAGRIYFVSGAEDDPSGLRTLVWYGSKNIATTSVLQTDGARTFMVNKSFGSGMANGSSQPGISRSVEISEVSVYGSLQETMDDGGTTVHAINGEDFADFADGIVYQQPLFRNANKLVVDTHIGCSRSVEDADVTVAETRRMVHLAYANTGSFTEGGDFAHVISGTDGSGMVEESATYFRRHNTWLLGPGDSGYASALGPDLTLSPRVVSCALEGGKIRIRMEGNGRPFSATYMIETHSKDIDTALSNQQVGAT